jgi:hypothetical protein
MTTGYDPAFPTDSPSQTGPNTWHFSGMTMRQWYKGMALASIQAAGITIPPSLSNKSIAEIAGMIADAMLAEDEGHERKEAQP